MRLSVHWFIRSCVSPFARVSLVARVSRIRIGTNCISAGFFWLAKPSETTDGHCWQSFSLSYSRASSRFVKIVMNRMIVQRRVKRHAAAGRMRMKSLVLNRKNTKMNYELTRLHSSSNVTKWSALKAQNVFSKFSQRKVIKNPPTDFSLQYLTLGT